MAKGKDERFNLRRNPTQKVDISNGPPPPKPKRAIAPPPVGKKYPTQEDRAKKDLKNKAADIRMKGDKFRGEGAHRSADTLYRQADEIESRMASGSPQLDDKAMSDIRPSAHLQDRDRGGWGTRLGDN